MNDLGRFMLLVGPVSSAFDVATFLVLWFALGANTADRQDVFQTGWFLEGLLTQTLVIHVLRTAKVPFVQSTATPLLVWLTGAVVAVGLTLPFLPVGGLFGLVPLPPGYFAWLAAVALGYALLTQLVKGWYVRRFGGWL